MAIIRTLNSLAFISVFLSCQGSNLEKIGVPNEYAGFKVRASSNVRLYRNLGLTKELEKKIDLPKHVGSTPIKERYRNIDNNQIILEAQVDGQIFYIDEREIFYDYSDCTKFWNFDVDELGKLSGLTYVDGLGPHVTYLGSGAISNLYEDKEHYGFANFTIKLGKNIYWVATFEKTVGFCRGRSAISRILDYAILGTNRQANQQYVFLCNQSKGDPATALIILSKAERALDEYFVVNKAWKLNSATESIDFSNAQPFKCKNPCPRGCGP